MYRSPSQAKGRAPGRTLSVTVSPSAAVLHDYLTRNPQLVSRKDADGIFLRVLRELDVPEWRARAMYLGVRVAHRLNL